MKKRLISGLIILALSAGMFSNVKVSAATATNPPVGVYRLYNSRSGEHFYTKSAAELNALEKAGWKYEGISFIHDDSGIPIYRLYNPVVGVHHYTRNEGEKNALVNKYGWKYEGVAFKVAATGSPVHRLYNPNNGLHHYTSNEGEKNALVTKFGWKYENIAWYTADVNKTLKDYYESGNQTSEVYKPNDTTKPSNNVSNNSNSTNTNNSNANSSANTNSSNSNSNSSNTSNSNVNTGYVNNNVLFLQGEMTEADIEVIRTRFIELLNEYRVNYGTGAVTYDSDLNKLAKVRATEAAQIKASKGFLTHDRVGYISGATEKHVYDEPQYAYIKNKFDADNDGKFWAAENLLTNRPENYGPELEYKTRQEALYATAELFFNQWKGSEEHNRILLTSYNESIGLSLEYYNEIQVMACFITMGDK